MAILINEDYMKQTFNIHKDVTDNRISPYIKVASRRLQNWVGATIYETTDEDLKDVLKLAEGTLAMHYMIGNLNTNIRPKGLVATESVEGNITVRYLNPGETLQSEADFLARAEEIVRDLILNPDIPPTVEVADNE